MQSVQNPILYSERIKDLMEKGLWDDERSVLGLPKTKIVRIKTKSAKAKTEEEGQEGAAEPEAGAAEETKKEK